MKEGEEFSPGLVVQGLGVEVVQLSAGDSHTAALTAYGEVYCWGVFRVSPLGFRCMEGEVHPSPDFFVGPKVLRQCWPLYSYAYACEKLKCEVH